MKETIRVLELIFLVIYECYKSYKGYVVAEYMFIFGLTNVSLIYLFWFLNSHKLSYLSWPLKFFHLNCDFLNQVNKIWL
jgi:hypothetical protein